MNIYGKTFEELGADDIRALLTDEEIESLYIEFKKQKYGKDKEEKKEFCKDISGFANAFGGYLILGIEAQKKSNRARAICDIPDAEEFCDDFIKIALTKIDPPIMGLDHKIIRIDDKGDKKSIVVFYVPNSSMKPHMNKFDWKFYKRNPTSTDPMSTNEIKEIVMNAHSMTQSVRGFVSRMLNASKYLMGDIFFIGITPIKTPLDQGVYSKEIVTLIDEYRRKSRISCFPHYNYDITPILEGYSILEPFYSQFMLSHGGHMHYGCKTKRVLLPNTEKPLFSPARIAAIINSIIEVWNTHTAIVPANSDILVKLYIDSTDKANLPNLMPNSRNSSEVGNPSGRRFEESLDMEMVFGHSELKLPLARVRIANRVWNGFRLEKCLYYDDKGKFLLKD